MKIEVDFAPVGQWPSNTINGFYRNLAFWSTFCGDFLIVNFDSSCTKIHTKHSAPSVYIYFDINNRILHIKDVFLLIAKSHASIVDKWQKK